MPPVIPGFSALGSVPHVLVLCFAVPESVVILSFVYNVWLMVISYSHQLCKDAHQFTTTEKMVNLAITIFATLFIVAQLVVFSLFLMDVISA